MIQEFIVILAGLNLFLIAAALVWSRTAIKKQFGGIRKITWLLLLIIFIFGLSLRIMPSHHHMMYIDEYWTMDAAKNILLDGRAELCEYTDYETTKCIPYPKLIGPPLLFSLSFLSGISNYNAIYMCTFLGSISIVLMFLLSYLVFKREDVALYSSILFATYPLYIMWSGSASTNTPGIFFLLLTLFSFFLHFKARTQGTYVLALFSLAFAIQTRLELILLLPLVPVMHALFDRDFKKRIKNPGFWSAWTVFLLFFVSFIIQAWVHILQIIEASGPYNPQVYTHIQVLSMYLSFIFDTQFFLLIALAAIAILSSKEKKPVFFLFLIFLLFFAALMVILLVKLIISAYVGLFLLSACGAGRLADALKIISGRIAASILITFMLLALFFPYAYPYSKYRLTEIYYIEPKILETIVLERAGTDIPGNCYVISEYPSSLATAALKAMKTEIALNNPSAVENIYEKTGCVIFYEDIMCFLKRSTTGEGCVIFHEGWCYVEDPLPECEDLKEKYSAKPYKEYVLGNFTYTFYSLSVQT